LSATTPGSGRVVADDDGEGYAESERGEYEGDAATTGGSDRGVTGAGDAGGDK